MIDGDRGSRLTPEVQTHRRVLAAAAAALTTRMTIMVMSDSHLILGAVDVTSTGLSTIAAMSFDLKHC